jgi:hypothetical protein
MHYLDSDAIFSGLQRCTRCLLPDSFPHIQFDDSGVCNYCHSDTRFAEQREAVFTDLLDEYRGKGKEYDCIAPISGGRDSAYVLHQMVTKYGMRTLALTVDSGFITDEALNNIETITSMLGVEHV